MTAIKNLTPRFPVVVLSEDDPMIYVFPRMDMPMKTYWDFYAEGAYQDDTIIDSTGRKFKAVHTRLVKFGKFGGYNLHFKKGSRTIWIDFEWEPQVRSVSLNDLKETLKRMAVQMEEFWEEKFGDMEELCAQVDKTESHEALFKLFQ